LPLRIWSCGSPNFSTPKRKPRYPVPNGIRGRVVVANKQELNSIVNRLVNASDPEQIKRAYKQWADTYDDDLDSFGYVAPRIGVDRLVQQLHDKSALIHDAGCGTGLVGTLLHQLGYEQLHGSDFSTGMLEKAALTGCYTDLQTADFSAPVNIASNTYDAVISIGVYSKRFNNHFISEMVRITRPTGYFIFSCRELYFEEVMGSVSSLLKSHSIARVSVEFDEYMTGQNASAFYIGVEKAADRS